MSSQFRLRPLLAGLAALLVAPASQGQDYSEQDLTGLSFAGLNLAGASFLRSDLTSANLSGANLSGANFTDANLTSANLAGANLTGAVLTGATLVRARFTSATVWPAGFSVATRPMIGPGAGLAGVDLQGLNLDGADFTGANLSGTRLAGARLHATLIGANLATADLRWADLAGATLTGAVLTGAIRNDATRWPTGFDPVAAGTVTRGPLITSPPESRTAVPGQAVTFSVTATGTPPLRYQWYRSGQAIPGETHATFTLAAVAATDAGTYTVDVTDGTTSRVTSVAGGNTHTLFATADTGLWAMGYNVYQQLLDGTTTGRTLPVRTPYEAIGVAAGGGHSAFIRPDGTLWTAGWNDPGQIGDGTRVNRSSPFPLATDVRSVTAGEQNTFFIRADGTLWATGSNYAGQLGDGTSVNRTLPFQIASGVHGVSTGTHHTLFVKTDGTLWAMGANGYGQLADGTTTQRFLPVQVATGVAAVSTGFYHTIFLKTDGTVWACGYNSSGQLGDGTTEHRVTPLQVASGVASIAAGGGHTLFLRTDGTLWAMGNNDYGQLGDGTTLDRTLPVQVATDVIRFAGAWVTTFWTRRDGSLWSAGRNAEGQLGLGHYDTPPGPSPVPGTGVTSASATLALAPVVTQSPASVMTIPGAAVTFSVTGEGFPVPTYQWRRNGIAIPGATNATYTLPAVTAAHLGNYDVVLTNSAGSVTSGAAALILASLQLEGSTWYLPGGGTVTVHASLNYTGLQPTALGFLVELPAGWSLASVSGTAVPNVAPAPGTPGNLEFAYTTMPANEAAFSLGLSYPAGLAGDQQLRATATYRSPLQTQSLAPLTLTRLDPPTLTTLPAAGVRRAGTPFTLTVAATSLVPATYQWRKDGTNLPGATAAQLAFTSLQLADAGSYAVALTNPGGTTVSPAVPLAVIEVQASHAFAGAGYLPGGTVTVTNSVSYSPALSGLTWEVLPPAGWSYLGGSGSEGTSRPAVGAQDLLTWSWSPVPAGSVQFSYQLQAPANATSDASLTALVRPALAAGSIDALVLPDPLPIPSTHRHSADTNRDLLLSLLELTRVIELYNTRNGQVRTGAYQVLAGTEDGFAADATRSATAVVPLGRYHSADTDRNGRLSLLELTRVIELYNHRETGVRTGRYSTRPGSEDGFAPGG